MKKIKGIKIIYVYGSYSWDKSLAVSCNKGSTYLMRGGKDVLSCAHCAKKSDFHAIAGKLTVTLRHR